MTEISNPLLINLKKQTQVLLGEIPLSSPHFTVLKNATTRSELLAIISDLLAFPYLTLRIATLFRPLLLDLCSRWLLNNRNGEERLEAFALLLEVHTELFPVFSAFLRGSDFEGGPLAFLNASEDVTLVDSRRLHRILLAYYRILQANRELPNLLSWSLRPLSMLMWTPHPDTGVRFLAIRCYALQSGMGEAERVEAEKEIIGEVADVDCPIYYGQNADGTPVFLDGWLLPLVDVERILNTRQALLQPQNYYSSEDDSSIEPIHPAELSPYTSNIYGVLMFCEAGTSQPSSSMVMTPSSIDALRTLATHLSLGLPTLLTSPPSSGKSLLLSHLAATLYPHIKNQIITIHLADTSLDPRSLLGSYVSSTSQSGTFEWKEGVLVRAMREGKWVVFEDIDRGSNELLGLIEPLVESLKVEGWVGGRAMLEVPARGKVVARESFAVFATRSLLPSRNGNFPSPTFFGAHKLHEIVVASPSHDELRMIVEAKFPLLVGSASEGLIRLWEAVRALGTASSVRDVGLREMEKICLRINSLSPTSSQSMDVDVSEKSSSLSSVFPNVSVREDMLFEIRDVLFASGVTTSSARSHLDAVAAVVADHLGLTSERRDWVLTAKIPEFQPEKDVNGGIVSIRLGRTRLLANPVVTGIDLPPTRTFAMHKPATLLMSRIATALSLNEPLLLTGETGTGKTSVVTHLANLLRKPLISLNLSHQTESSDIVGGFKPIDARIPASELQERFLNLFGGTFSRKRNAKFDESVRKAVQESKWKRAVALWIEASRMAKKRMQTKAEDDQGLPITLDDEGPRKRRKTEKNTSSASWEEFERDVRIFEAQHIQGNGKFAFGFVEGPLVKALRFGHWILLDEINLASAETLESISSLLHSPTASITLTEQGSLEPVVRHSDFRLFACMNPATDVGKKDLPPNIRSRFTEINVPPPDDDKETLLSIVAHYISPYAVGDKGAVMDVAEFYSAVRKLAEKREIADGSNHRPHFSMRTLARALTFAADMAGTQSLRRALWEGCLMAFTMILDEPSTTVVTSLAQKHILAGVRNPRSLLAKEPSSPPGRSVEDYVKFGPFYIERGPLPEDPMDDYIMTPSVETKLIDLARIITTRRFPVLIEGPTSSGKTSSIEYLAKRTGHRFVRINNHEHTDIQEYIGTYVSDPTTGKLIFTDGLLVRALRNGDWIVLDELNLAPTDVLEALNRLLDDNRELVIPETQEVVRPHPHFLLFATQNPSGLYGGRKVLSRAFRNRFLEVHFDDVPQTELEIILCQRCKIAPSYAQRIVSVFQELQRRRQSSRIFESKHGFATLRDLFRWAGRDAINYQELAENGYMLLAERARKPEDKAVAKQVIESIMKVKIDEVRLYELHNASRDSLAYLGCPVPQSSHLVWTSAMQRLFILVARALRFHEPVLLVGETGSGKTSVCQLYAEVLSRKLHAISCHQNTETADLIGGLRPLRNRVALESDVTSEAQHVLNECGVLEHISDVRLLGSTVDTLLLSSNLSTAQRSQLLGIRSKLQGLSTMFKWYDGPLVDAMRNGDIFLLDEISLADDSVLERLNSVLEPSRTIVLAERGDDGFSLPLVTADEHFEIVATMNPGGDYGKKELSPALRNRFTEIWVPAVDDRRDLEQIVCRLWKYDELHPCTKPLLDFTEWLSQRISDQSLVGLRDILAWVDFSNVVYQGGAGGLTISNTFHHAAHMTFLDGLAAMPQLSAYSASAIRNLRSDAISMLDQLFPDSDHSTNALFYDSTTVVQLGPFVIPKGPKATQPDVFSFQAPTTQDNVARVVRGCQLTKPVLLEGSPGVGKTSLVAALANICGYDLCRINLSDQTDLVDLFGSDLPVEGGGPGQFAWRDAEFLRAMQEGHWVLLDEMNLAPQAILEGLNAVLDHRGSVYIPELGRTFFRHPSFRIFAAQNPLHQGGGRKGLPKSFLNRFTKVYVQELSSNDIHIVFRGLFPSVSEDLVHCMITYTARLQEEVMVKRTFGREGSPWEFNLRDVIRWGALVQNSGGHPGQFLHTVFLERFRTASDRREAKLLFCSLSPGFPDAGFGPRFTITPSFAQFGRSHIQRTQHIPEHRPGWIVHSRLSALESLSMCVSHGWLGILTGPQHSGKTTLVRTLASLTGHFLREIHMNSATDTSDLLGSFEEVDVNSRSAAAAHQLSQAVRSSASTIKGSKLYQSREFNDAVRGSQGPAFNNGTSLQSSSRILSSLLASNLTAESPSSLTSPSPGKFEWIDGPLVEAIRDGHWVLLDGANLCNPSVLDRLNSLFEINGQLTLNERGALNGEVQVIKPHPSFRLFMVVDPRFGELSRAMRNRGIEIAVMPLTPEDAVSLLPYMRLAVGASATVPLPQSLLVSSAYTRRGILQEDSISESSVFAASNTLYSHDSISASLGEFIPDLRAGDVVQLEPLLLFIVQSVSPIALPLLRRLAVHLQNGDHFRHSLPAHISHLPNTKAYELTTLIRQRVGMDNQLPMELLSSQPFDLKMHRLTLVTDVEETTSSILVLHLRLTMVLSLVRDQLVPNRHMDSSLRQYTTAHRRVVDAVLGTVQSVCVAALELSDRLVVIDKDTYALLNLASRLLGYSRFLTRIISADVLDYSALHAASSWFADAFRENPGVLETVHNDTHGFKDAVSLKSGLGISQLWSSFSNSGLSVRAADDETLRLEDAAYGLSSDFRSSILELIALRQLSSHTSSVDLQNLRGLTDRISAPNHQSNHSPHKQHFDSYVHIAELSLLSAIFPSDNTSMSKATTQAIRGRLDLATHTVDSPLQRLAPYVGLLWPSNIGSSSRFAMITTLYREWLEVLWTASITEEIAGPSLLHVPVQTFGIITLCDWNSETLSTISTYEHSLRQRSKLVLSQIEQPSRAIQLAKVLLRSLLLVLSPFNDGLDHDTYKVIQSFPLHLELEWQEWIRRFCASVVAIKYDYVARTFEKTLQPYLIQISKCRLDEDRIWPHLGRCFVSLCHFIIDLFVPDRPIDPASIDRFSQEYKEEQDGVLHAQIEMHRKLERQVSGQSLNGTITFLQFLRPDMSRATSSHLLPRRDVSRLHSYWAEVDQLLKLVVAPAKVGIFLDQQGSFDPSMVQRELVVQDSVAAFCQRLDTAYSDFVDLSHPLQLALQFLRLGLRLARPKFASVDCASTRILVAALAAFPAVKSAQILQTQSASQQSFSATFDVLVVRVAAVTFEVSIGVDVGSRMGTLSTLYDQALGLWIVERARDAEQERESQSLYKSKASVSDGTNDAELEEEEFRSLFPEYSDVLDIAAASASAVHPSRLVDSTLASSLVHMHEHLFSSLEGDAYVWFTSSKNVLLEEAIETHIDDLPDSLDTETIPLQISLLRNRLSSFTSSLPVPHAPQDFYSDPDVKEARKFVTVLTPFVARLQELIVEWPDQMVLHHLKARCEAALSLKLHSPVAKLLAALEQLLVQSEDWESFAHRGNSIQPHRQTFANLIVEWRRLELLAWRDLLEIQATRFTEGLSEWWFRLYEVCIHGLLKAVHESDEDSAVNVYLDGLVPLLQDYLTSSPLGQYVLRLRLLSSFEGYATQLSRQASLPESLALRRICRILHSFTQYYGQFESRVASSLAEQRRTLEKDIRGFIKIASWRDINVQALKQSAQKTHHQLYKIIRKFRDILRQPVTDLLRPVQTDHPTTIEDAIPTSSGVDNDSAFPESTQPLAGPNHLRNLTTTFKRFTGFIDDQLTRLQMIHTPRYIEALAGDIIATAQSLSDAGVPLNIDATRRTILLKNLLQRKRKAWSDMLKELKRAGLTANIKPDVLLRQRSLRWLREQASLTTLPSHMLGNFDIYWHRLLGSLPALRGSLGDHHNDLSTRDLTRGLMFVESGFFVALSARERLSDVHISLERLRGTASRMNQISQCPEIYAVGPEATSYAAFVMHTVCKAISALKEMNQHLRLLSELPGDVHISDSLFIDVQASIEALQHKRESVASVYSNVQLTTFPLMLENEYNILKDSILHVKEIEHKLLDWSTSLPHTRAIILPVYHWLSSCAPPVVSGHTKRDSENHGDDVIATLLLTIQSLMRLRSGRETQGDEDQYPDDYVKEGWNDMSKVTASLNLTTIGDQSASFLQSIAQVSASDVSYAIRRVSPFLRNYLVLAESLLRLLASWTKSLLKLDYVLCSIVSTIAKDGFCQPKETQEGEDGGDGGETMEGTGLGEGTGAENVSKEIQDESQVEGLQGDGANTDEDVERAEEDNAIEMGDDFGGRMQDIPEDNATGDDEDEDASDDEPEDQLGALDANDETAVDEKLWGDEQGPEGRDETKQSDKDHSTQSGGPQDIVAKEDSHQNDVTDKNEAAELPEDAPEEDSTHESSIPEETTPEEHEDVGKDGAPLDDHLQCTETLELPDDMDMDPEKQAEDSSKGEDISDDAMSGIEEPDAETAAMNEPENVEDDVEDRQTQQDDTLMPGGLHEDDTAQDTDKDASLPDMSAGDDVGDSASTNVQSGDTETSRPNEEDEASGKAGGPSQRPSNVEANKLESSTSEAQAVPTEIDEEAAAPSGSDTAAGQVQQSQGHNSSPTQSQEFTNQPIRSLGDALKEITRRFDEILQSERSRVEVPEQSDSGGPSQVEYLQQDEDEDMQALGPAGDENSAKLDELKFATDSEEEPTSTESTAPMDVESIEPDVRSVKPNLSSLSAEPATSNPREGIESALTGSDVQNSRPPGISAGGLLEGIPGGEITSRSDHDDVNAQVERELREWQSQGQPSEQAEHMWRLYESLTHDLSYALCEQLRLILEPTQATRLKGDYRTGKRLNMKKIIPYIASEFTKDKIWLRRTRPSQREYQVLVALDDSRSMAESHSVHLAFQTLALVSKALSRLEVGDIAIAKFGEAVEILHGFDKGPFTDQAGTAILDAFQFDQKATQVLSLVDTSLHLLEAAREQRTSRSSTAADLWQMEIIISDGICQDHEKLATALRKAEEQRVMVVFIILDSLHSRDGAPSTTIGPAAQNSILSMSQVAYKEVNGKMDLAVTRYLDTFPFEYYVVVRDVEALPDVLAGTLKQFFERISED